MSDITEFVGALTFDNPYATCGPITVHGHWTLKDIGKPYKVWCNEGLYAGGINEIICEIHPDKEV